MNAELIAIGTELLLGYTVNSDTVYLSRVLAELGIDCYHHVTVGDNRQRLAEAIRTALSRADLVITCGGLGPTVDDVTLETIASVTGRRLLLNPTILRRMEARFRCLKIAMPKTNVRQAMIPEGAVIFPNQTGTAPGFMIKRGQTLLAPKGSDPLRICLLIALPGPPSELIPMVEKHLIPRLRQYAGKTVIHSKTLKVVGLTESAVDVKVRDILALKGKVTVGIYAHPGEVELRITAKAASAAAGEQLIGAVERRIRKRFKGLIFGADEETLEQVAGKLLKRRHLTLAVAESCTGGLIGHRLTEVPGSSDYFRGGVVAYAHSLKSAFGDVPARMIQKEGAVSAAVAKRMASGIRQFTQSDLGLAVTGIAGPTGGTKRKPVGLVYIALAGPRALQCRQFRFSGNRSAVKLKASQAALDMVRKTLGV